MFCLLFIQINCVNLINKFGMSWNIDQKQKTTPPPTPRKSPYKIVLKSLDTLYILVGNCVLIENPYYVDLAPSDFHIC